MATVDPESLLYYRTQGCFSALERHDVISLYRLRRWKEAGVRQWFDDVGRWAGLLVEHAPRSLDEIRQVLAESSSAPAGGAPLSLPELSIRWTLISPPSPFSEYIRDLWAAGAIDWQDTRGLVVKTAFLAFRDLLETALADLEELSSREKDGAPEPF